MNLNQLELDKGCLLLIYSHSDTSCIGRHGRILDYISGRECTVQPFNDKYKPMEGIGIVNSEFDVDKSDG